MDAKGRFGAPMTQVLTAQARAPSDTVAGALMVTLTWDTESDLDLHVVDPLGDEIYHGQPSSVDPFGGSDNQSVGLLDFDSNANCTIDGRREEDVTWKAAPPSGHYLVRVDATSLCGTPDAHYRTLAKLNGRSIGEAVGVMLDQDTWGAHDRGAGILALAFDVP